MASCICVEALVSSAKRLKISGPKVPSHRALHRTNGPSRPAIRTTYSAIAKGSQTSRHASQVTASEPKPKPETAELQHVRLPKAVQAVFLAPLRRAPTHGIPVCDLQVRSYSVRNLEAFTDFCMRAAYYLKLPAKGPVPLPRITERWTVPRSNFVHKKSQENFERVTMRRLIQIQDGHLDTVAVWLAYIQKQRYYGVGMKANVYQHSGVDAARSMVQPLESIVKATLDGLTLDGLNSRSDRSTLRNDQSRSHAEAFNLVGIEQPYKAQWGAWSGMGGLQNTASGRRRFTRHKYKAAQSEEEVQTLDSAGPSLGDEYVNVEA